MESFLEEEYVSLTDFADLEGVPARVIDSAAWLSDQEAKLLADFQDDVKRKLLLSTAAWIALHAISQIVSPLLGETGSTMARKDKFLWHNKVVSSTHAVFAVALGLWWLFASGEYQLATSKAFVFLPYNANIAIVGAGYFLYDTLFTLLSFGSISVSFFVMLMAHHLIFIVAYFSTLVYPCSLSVTTYHFFQLTELSTVFLHLTWMCSKAQVQYRLLFMNVVLLLATFLQRVAMTAFILWHVCVTVARQKLWSMVLPGNLEKYTYPYLAYFIICCVSMLILNFKWFMLIVGKAKDIIKRVQEGKTPTCDYDRPIKKMS